MAKNLDKELGFEPINEEESSAPNTNISQIQSLGKGIQSGATLGFSDELAGLVQQGLDVAAPTLGIKPITQTNQELASQGILGDIGPQNARQLYEQARNEERAALQAAKLANSKTFLGGEVLGGLAVPMGASSKAATTLGKAALGVGAGALSGAVSTAGVSEEMPTSADIAKGAAIGAGIGAGAPLLGVAAKGLTNKIKNTEIIKELSDIYNKTAEGVDLSNIPEMRNSASDQLKKIITAIDKSNLNKIKQRDKLLSEIPSIDVKDESTNLLNSLEQLKAEASATAEPVINRVQKDIQRVYTKGSEISGNEFKQLESKLEENIAKAKDAKDTILADLLEQYKNLVKEKVYSSNPEIASVRKNIGQENEMLKLLTGEAAPDMANKSPAEMEKLLEQSLTKLEAKPGSAQYSQTQKFFEGVPQTPGIRSSEIPGFQQTNLKSSLELQDKLRNLELAKGIEQDPILAQGGIKGLLIGGSRQAAKKTAQLAGEMVKTTKSAVKTSTDEATKALHNTMSSAGKSPQQLNQIASNLAAKGNTAVANTMNTIAKEANLNKRQAMIFAAMQKPEFRQAVSEDLGFELEQKEK